MPRLTESERVDVRDAYRSHWQSVNAQAGQPVELEPGFGFKQFEILCDAYDAKTQEIRRLVEVIMPQRRAERDAIFGSSAQDENGLWFWLIRYKTMARARLGSNNPLNKTVPNLGRVQQSRLLTILENFIEHWDLVNNAISPDLTIGPFDLTKLKAAYKDLKAKIKEIHSIESIKLPLARAEREKIFGDVPDNERDDKSIISRMLMYRVTIESLYPNQPLAQSIPRIFPATTSESIPTFPYNWVALADGQVQTWFTLPESENANQLYLQEGVIEQTVPLNGQTAGSQVVTVWENIAVVGDLDVVEIRDANGRTLFRGTRNTSLPQPSPSV